jgi:Asp-tRNA(Asn)/Glu-tRNA(Gln) amidotransferase A subunit family amidase
MAKTAVGVILSLLAIVVMPSCSGDTASSTSGGSSSGDGGSFQLMEATIDDVHAAYRSGQLTARQLVQRYLDRIAAFDQEGFASIRRPATWNTVVGMRPTTGLTSRTGVYGGHPSPVGLPGPMARTVTDLAKLLDVIVGYDREDPVTALGIGHVPQSYTQALDRNGLQGARIGIIREAFGTRSDPDSEDFRKSTRRSSNQWRS